MGIAIIVVICVAVLWAAFSIVRSYLLYRKTLVLERKSFPFSREVPNTSFKILVLGDSTAVGIGVDRPEDSTAGRLGAAYPGAEVVNLSVSGLRIKGLEAMLQTRDAHEHFDIVLIQIGANDIIRFTPLVEVRKGIKHIIERNRKFGGKTIVLHSGNVGDSKFFPLWVRPFLSKRSFAVRKIYQEVAGEYDASYVDLISSPSSEAMKSNPSRYYAADFLHLSGEGYGLWYEEIKKNL